MRACPGPVRRGTASRTPGTPGYSSLSPCCPDRLRSSRQWTSWVSGCRHSRIRYSKPGSSTIGIGSGEAGATAPTTIFASALGEYDQACCQHDAEMDGIRQACLAKWGKVPLLETYRQMTIRQQKAHNYRQALWWAERGIAIYGNDCARPDAVEDLRTRAAKYRAKLAG